MALCVPANTVSSAFKGRAVSQQISSVSAGRPVFGRLKFTKQAAFQYVLTACGCFRTFLQCVASIWLKNYSYRTG